MLNAFAIAALALPQALVAPEPAVTDIPSGWSVIGESPKDARIELNFAVKQRNLQSLHDTLLSVSDPKSPSYGEHLSNEAVHALIKPSDEDIATVHSFINTVAGVEPRAASPNSDFITAVMTIGQAEALLGAKYEVLRHGRAGVRTTGRAAVATGCPSLSPPPSTLSLRPCTCRACARPRRTSSHRWTRW